jgi:chromosome segregation ATPase
MTKAALSAVPSCQLPGCSNPVEQPPGGGPRKRFCCDQHRLQYWRQSQREGKVEDQRAASDDTSAMALKAQLEQSLTTLEAVVMRTRTTLIELSSLEEAEAIRKETFAIAEEQVARAQAERAAEERRRQAAESLAEAASAMARETEAQLKAVIIQIEALTAENQGLEQQLKKQASQAQKDLESAVGKAQRANDKLSQEIRGEIAARAKAEARADSAETRVQELKTELLALRGAPPKTKPASKKSKKK